MTDPFPYSCPCAVAIGDLALLVRPLRRDDRNVIEDRFHDLSARSRFFRFLSPLNTLPEPLIRHLTEIDHDKHDAWVAGVERGDGGNVELIGVSRYVRATSEAVSAEMAITVADAFQHKGVGAMLLYVLAQSAADHGVEIFTALVHHENSAMKSFLRAFGAKAGRPEGETVTYQFRVDRVIGQLGPRFAFEPLGPPHR